MKQIIFTNVNYDGNAGDFWSTPLKYYNFDGYPTEQVHFMDIWAAIQNKPNHEQYLIKDSLSIGYNFSTKKSYISKQLTQLIVKL